MESVKLKVGDRVRVKRNARHFMEGLREHEGEKGYITFVQDYIPSSNIYFVNVHLDSDPVPDGSIGGYSVVFELVSPLECLAEL